MFENGNLYIVVEIQAQGDTASTLTNVYTDRKTAENKYHTVLAAAAVSNVPIHSATMMNELGFVIKSEYYKHEVEENIEL